MFCRNAWWCTIGGHLGEKMISRLKERFYWPGQSEDVKKWCQNCCSCAMKQTPAVTFCTDTQYNSLRQALVSRDRDSPGVWGKRTKCQPFWTSHCTRTHAHTHTHTKHTFMRSLVLIHWLAILFRRGYSPSPSHPSVGTGFGCESHHTVSDSRSVHATHTMHMNQARSH